MTMLVRLLAAAALACALSACGSRSILRASDAPGDDSAQAGASGRAGGDAGDGGRGGDRDGAGAGGAGRGGSGAGGRGGGNAAGDGSAGSAARGGAGAGAGGEAGFSAGSAGAAGFSAGAAGFSAGAAGFSAGAAGFSAGASGVGGIPPGAGEGGFSGTAGEILNPQGCATPHPFVLSIDPSGRSGSVSGWLESAAGIVFEDQLPRFVRAFNPELSTSERAIGLWWSIGSVGVDGQGLLYFYAGDFTGTRTEIAEATGASGLAAIDIDALAFTTETIEAQTGSMLAFRNVTTGETVALRVDRIFTAARDDGFGWCAAVEASWLFLR